MAPTEPTYRAALFDLDDTLLNSSAAKWLHHRTIAKRHYGLDITDDELRTVWGMPFLRMIELSYRGVDDPERIRELLLASNDEFPKLEIAGAADAITRLLDADLHVGVITSAPTDAAVFDLGRLGFPVDRLLCVLGEDAVHVHKPDPGVFDQPLALLAAHGIRPQDVVYTGDLLLDHEAAIAAGLDFIAVTSGIATHEAFAEAGATTITAGIVDAVDVILTRS